MDYPRIKTGVLLCLLSLSACVAQKTNPNTGKSFFSCSLQPTTLLIMSEQFLEWQKGYSIKIRDHDRGMTVTDWILESPTERHRITLRTMIAPRGSLISTHTEIEVLENQDWVSLPTTGALETKLLSELRNYIQTSPALKDQKVLIYD
jgi:hypothetical protein